MANVPRQYEYRARGAADSRQKHGEALFCHCRGGFRGAVICAWCDNGAQMIEAAGVMMLCFIAGYALKARLAARERRRRMFRRI
jgi:hypothetical protein